ncbi:tRNA pseudouridine32 synthase/23S rRNA pseudouridine746 synthase [Corynebacterium guangdongense]|uniref:RNA pseudouridylate synthase n=1 Tax=Corynebacterium guangdongense TaxID=1783348 RepID=A0ABU1ZVY5_9CORY|nr:pseudouridine synthase [Corynebacterium guangdongense]MDR7329020.1 tRNA pseudouridine32 synthase/23S rRNA pseudouridine746 synthase [Corynebacterium guangdongense]
MLEGTVPAGEYWAARAGDSAFAPGQVLRPGTVVGRIPAWTFPDLAPEKPIPFDYRVLHVDEELVVVDKPHFLPSTSNGRLVTETAQTRLRREFGEETAPLHRLDRLTAGVLVSARTSAARSRYQRMFAARRVGKTYLARVDGVLDYPDWVEIRLGMTKAKGRRQVTVDEAGTPTRTWIRSLAPDVVELRPTTGHTHQLRVLLNHLGAPIHGDDTYPVDRGLDLHDFTSPLQLYATAVTFPDGRAFRSRPGWADRLG